jgi:hypothetical protein
MNKPNKVDVWLLKASYWLLYPFFKSSYLLEKYRRLFLSGLIILLLFFSMVRVQPDRLTWANWTGFGEDSNISKEETLQGGKLTITKRITHFQSGKNLWDWLGLIGVIAIPIFLFQYQIRQQEIADSNQREEALRDYIDKIAELLIDKELKVLLKQLYEGVITKNDATLDAALDVARARTLSILRRLDKDHERKGSVVQFLIDAELIQGLELLKYANLSRANLYEANLEGANLKGADLKGADLEKVNLKGANLEGANLEGANLERANLEGTNLEGAYLKRAYLIETNLIEANLVRANLIEANLIEANLERANLEGAYLKGAYLKGAKLEGAKLEKTILKKISSNS